MKPQAKTNKENIMKKELTIGMATYDDYSGVYFTIESLLLYHPIAKSNSTEIIVVDNNPSGNHGKFNQKLINGWLKHKVKYIPFVDKKSTAVRNEIFNNAEGKYCISLDSHVMLAPGSLDSLLDYYQKNPDCKDIVSGPMLYDNLNGYATHFKPTWGGDMYGQWDRDEESMKKQQPFDIPMMGLGVFSSETKNWLGFNKHFKGFGGEEGYIHEKYRDNGGRSICLPGFKWIHRFGRPDGVPYPLALEDRIWNYFIGWLELKSDPEHPMLQEIYNNFKTRIPEKRLQSIFKKAIKLNEEDKINSQKEQENATPVTK
jgi:hypothetical protein